LGAGRGSSRPNCSRTRSLRTCDVPKYLPRYLWDGEATGTSRSPDGAGLRPAPSIAPPGRGNPCPCAAVPRLWNRAPTSARSGQDSPSSRSAQPGGNRFTPRPHLWESSPYYPDRDQGTEQACHCTPPPRFLGTETSCSPCGAVRPDAARPDARQGCVPPK